eukprot:jgi/Undpi1/2019/HiC_scaffold_12.g05405.m1
MMERLVLWSAEQEYIVKKSLVFVTPGVGLDAAAIDLADSIGFDVGTMKYVLLLLAAYPLAAVFSRLPNATTKHFFSALVGVWMMQFVFYGQWIHSFVSALVTYVMVLALPNKYMPKVVFAFVLGYISLSHLYRAYVDYMGWSLDFTGPQMVLTIKLSSFAYNVWDGRKWAEIEKDTGDKKKDRVLAARREYAIRSVPNPLEFFGYVYCFSSILAGPAFEYTLYDKATSGEAYRKVSWRCRPLLVEPPTASLRPLPSLSLLLTWYFLFCFVLVFLILSFWCSLILLLSVFFCSSYFCKLSFFVIFFYLVYGASVLGGFGFQGYAADGTVIGWDGVSNIDIMAFETSPSVVVNTRAWNKRTQGWLERYVYMRTGNSLVATYFVSAFWHGFYPGYYLFFMSLPVVTAVSRELKKKVSPYVPTEGAIGAAYHVLCVCVVSLTVNYLVIPFQILGLPESLEIWGTFYFGVHAISLALYVVCMVVPAKKIAKKTA